VERIPLRSRFRGERTATAEAGRSRPSFPTPCSRCATTRTGRAGRGRGLGSCDRCLALRRGLRCRRFPRNRGSRCRRCCGSPARAPAAAAPHRRAASGRSGRGRSRRGWRRPPLCEQPPQVLLCRAVGQIPHVRRLDRHPATPFYYHSRSVPSGCGDSRSALAFTGSAWFLCAFRTRWGTGRRSAYGGLASVVRACRSPS
jgi:hypothetical protein